MSPGVSLRPRSLARVLAASLVLASIASAAACSSAPEVSLAPAPPAPAVPATDLASVMRAYVDDPAVGRRALEASLVTRDNTYAALRLAEYDAARWGALPELDAPTTPIGVSASGGPAPPPPAGDPAWATLDAASASWTESDLRALGERAFFRYPLQTSAGMPRALAEPDRAGVWQDEGRFGAVWVSLPRGVTAAALTCATCHASKVDGRLVAGRNNPDLDAGRVYGDGTDGLRWGLGRVDVTMSDGVDNPVAITDLRPLRHQQHLHHAATLRNEPVALAVRIETLMITSHGQSVRPPRKVAAALAVYLLGLAPKDPLPGGDGAGVFARECGGCHRGESASGAPVSLEAIGTDPRVGASRDRGTGSYRVPSLRAVGDRRRLFASGDVEDIEDLLSPARKAEGHRYGLSLDAADRAALLGYLRRL